MKKIACLFLFFISSLASSQDLIMQDGLYVRCAPNRFLDSGGESNSYGSNESFTTTICPENSDDVILLQFQQFSTQPNEDIMTIYDGDSTSSPVIGNYSGILSPENVFATNPMGCLTITFNSNGFGNTLGWIADIVCAERCQMITPSIDSTVPFVNASGVIEIFPGEIVTFNSSPGFSSGDDTGATYDWDFGTGDTVDTQNPSYMFDTPGTYMVTLTVRDNNPLGCFGTTSIEVFVADSIITINNSTFLESSFGLDELVEQVLVTGGCSAVDNFEVLAAGNPSDLTTKSYGYFTNGGAQNFPFEEGIVLSTGFAATGGNVATNTPGETGFTTGQAASDTDLETALGIAGTEDATFIKFDFTPISDTISFRYIMASEEYDGSTECNFADGFAFLLREVGTSTYINLAVLPDDTPVNVTNINNSPVCADNRSFFEGYNLGDTNFGGRTVVLTASADVTPNTTYEIKLVVADQGDNQFDTAIFLEAGSFNLGGFLGEDYTIGNGSALCSGDDITLDTNIPDIPHTWYKDGVQIPSETSSTYTVTETGVYSVEFVISGACSGTGGPIEVQFVNSPTLEGTPLNLSACSSISTALFNFTENTSIVLGTQDPSEFRVSYHNSLADAESDNNSIIDENNYVGSDDEVIFLRIEDTISESCYLTTSFTLDVFTTVTSEDYTFELCDNGDDSNDTNGIAEFNLSSIDDEVLGLQDPAQFSVSYHISNIDAINGDDPLPNLYTNTTANTQLIYARVENDANPECYETSMITLLVNALPVTNSPVQLLQCDDDADGVSDFNLTEAYDLIASNSADVTFTFYNNFIDADSGSANAITNVTAYTNTDSSPAPDILYVRVENDKGCYRVVQLELLVSITQIPPSYFREFTACDDLAVDNDITNGVTSFDFSETKPEIEALFPVGQSVTVSYYESTEDALAEINPIIDIENHRNTNSPFVQTIVVRVDSNLNNACLGLGERIVLRTTNPTPNIDPEDLITCDDVTVGDLSEVFDLRQNEAYIFNGETNLTASYFSDRNNALDGTVGEITTPNTYVNTNPTETIFVRVTNTTNNCFAIVDFDITVNPLPDAVPIVDLVECENNTDNIYDFDLGSKTDDILAGRSPSDFEVTYHRTQFDADNLLLPLGNMYTNIANPQQIFVAITNKLTGCSLSSLTFNIEVKNGAQANSDGDLLILEVCDDINGNDGSAQFDLTELELEILDGQVASEYTISYHATENDAINGVISLPTLYESIPTDGSPANSQTIYVRVSSNIAPDICFDTAPIVLLVNPLPEFDIENQYVLCTTINGTQVIPVPPIIETGLSATDYSFEWIHNGTLLSSETGPNLSPTEIGTYEVIVTDITTSSITMCNNMDITEVIESAVPDVQVELISQAFSGNNRIEVTPVQDNYEFSLDGGLWQDEGQFTNVSAGNHVITVRDKYGCGFVEENITVIDYPSYFTPNGDGINDRWNIVGIGTQTSAKIYIFDRFGKLLKQINPNSLGWDGTFKGNEMPSSDYWFTVFYNEPLTGQDKEFKAHFTLKR